MTKPRAVVGPVNEPYFTALADGRLLLQRCTACAATVHYPRERCPQCLAAELEWVQARGTGTVLSYAEVHKPQHPAFNADIPILFVAVALAEGPVVFGRGREHQQRGPGPSQEVRSGQLPVGSPVELDTEATRESGMYPTFRLT